MYVLSFGQDGRIVNLHQCDRRQLNVARTIVMQFVLVFVVLLFSAALILYASPLILYVAPVIALGIAISLLNDAIRHRSKTVKH